MRHLPKVEDERLLVGLDTADDAAVYKINQDLALIQTLDFFTPIVDDPYLYGQIAASNSLSDIYAMGGEPRLAMNIVCFPDSLEPEVLAQILKGGQSKVEEAGALLVGGHSVVDKEPKYGLSVTGFVHPEKVYTNGGAQIGDKLVLTKPLGLGIINTAIKGGLVDEESYKEAVETMATLNKYAKEAMDGIEGIHAVTDITGFGLLGHAQEMAEASQVSLKIYSQRVPIINKAIDYAKIGLVPAGAYTNRNHLKGQVSFAAEVETVTQDILFDPQTSGGLLIAVAAKDADRLLDKLKDTPSTYAIIGEVEKKGAYQILVE